jgi:hypothetical protein
MTACRVAAWLALSAQGKARRQFAHVCADIMRATACPLSATNVMHLKPTIVLP